MPTLPDWAIQILQVVSIFVLAPLVSGIIARVEAIVQQRTGPRILQPYYDIFKLLQKETVLPAPAGPVFRAAPYVSFAAYATIPLLIPPRGPAVAARCHPRPDGSDQHSGARHQRRRAVTPIVGRVSRRGDHGEDENAEN